MNLFDKFKALTEGTSTLYKAEGTGYTARVVQASGKHIAKFFKDGEHMKSSDYEGTDKEDAHGFAKDEMEFRKKEKSESVEQLDELSADKLKAYKEKIKSVPVADTNVLHKSFVHARGTERAGEKIKDISKKIVVKEENLDERINEPQGHVHQPDPITDASKEEGHKKKMMGNRTPMEIIAKILAGK